jgi:erythronate-4-phosphate dehydrogenase
MRIVADENIPGLDEWLGGFGEIERVDGRTLHAARLRGTEVLLVRSVTRVDAALLQNAPIRFVGTATAGIDHVDTALLAARGIRFASAPGCNAVAVAEYVLACCLLHAAARQRLLTEFVVGIIGHGQVGQAVAQLLGAVGARCVCHDPPREAAGIAGDYRGMDEALAGDVVTLHVPLTATGPYATRDLIGAAQIARMRPDALLINAARGGVLDETAWLAHAASRTLALDCWRGEPRISPAVLAHCWLASPHVAGHTVDARWRATGMLAEALAAAYDLPRPAATVVLPRARLALSADTDAVEAAVLGCCDPRDWTCALKGSAALPPDTQGQAFDALRKQCGSRREFSAHDLAAPAMAEADLAILRALRFGSGPGEMA